ncbi:MAG: M20/M25/M40 family metallo-hydrolase [Bacteroidetes bacterium]|nr:M20/M25/M40 family metallo-hydrolase [Bacteroidota bacterium]
MKQKKIYSVIYVTLFYFLVFDTDKGWTQTPDSVVIKKISDEIFVSGQLYKNEEYLCKKIGARLSGSANAEKAVQWTYNLMKSYGFDTVYLQEVMVPHWVRGEKEVGRVTSTIESASVDITALGGSIATSKEGLTAEVVEVKDFDELKKLGEKGVKGKIVFYNHPFDVRMIIPFQMYGEASKYRYSGPSEAARYGAVASIVRSMTNYVDDYPHTGSMGYNDSLPKIPACAISTQDAEYLSSVLKSVGKATFFLKMNCETLPDVKSHNVIGEMRGSEHPEEIISVGGHLDSWDLAEGAHDDGTGVMQSIEVLRTLKKIGVKPKRTMRAVMFMNEENGLKGGGEYANQAKKKNEKHILAMESDAGGFTPRGFNMTMPEDKKERIRKWKGYFYPYGAYDFTLKGGGADIGPLEKQGVPVIGFSPDNQRYFIIHHTAMDTFEQVNKRELEMGAVVMTMMVYLVSEYGL